MHVSKGGQSYTEKEGDLNEDRRECRTGPLVVCEIVICIYVVSYFFIAMLVGKQRLIINKRSRRGCLTYIDLL